MRNISRRQSTDTVLMIKPASFGANQMTAISNAFQISVTADEQVSMKARQEFDALVDTLRVAGVKIELFDDTRQPEKPDAVFPNNWVSFHADGSTCLYPMLAENRRFERRRDILDSLVQERGYRISNTYDFTGHESQGRFLEGTGSMVLDRINRTAYACLSPRTDEQLLNEWSARIGYEVMPFAAVDTDGRPVYHTNVMMCLGTEFAVVCVDSIMPHDREKVIRSIESSGHEVIAISMDQMNGFAGNMLELRSAKGDTLLAMSSRAESVLTAEQHARLGKFAKIVSSPIQTIEDCAGGSVRCMLAEVFLPHGLD